jgi:AcrR family transcriptional regulator
VSSAARSKHEARAGAEEAPARGRGRPRSEKAEQAILAATLRLVARVGLAGTTIEGVAAEAGVGKTTIYRRWKTKTDLILAATAAMVPPEELPDTGSLRGDLQLFAGLQRERLTRAGLHMVAPRILAEGMNDPDLHRDYVEQVIEPIRSAIGTLVRRGVERGELRPDADVEALVDILHAVPIYRIMISRGDVAGLSELPEPYLSIVTDGVSSSSAARGSAPPRSSGSSRARRARSG